MRTDKTGRIVALYVIVTLLFLALPFLTRHYSVASEMLIFAIFAMGYDILFGYTGLPSFGHAIFFGTGAYTLALLLIKWKVPLVVAFLGGCFAGTLAALIVGVLAIRRKGVYFVMITIALCQLCFLIGAKWTSLTGGENGLHGVPRPTLGPIHLASEIHFYYFVLFVFVVSILLAVRVVRSPFGRVIRSIQSNEERAKSIGFNTNRFKLLAFLISAFFPSLAGGLYALHLNFVPIETLSLDISGDVVLMGLIGGIGTLYGPVFGAMLLVYLKNSLSGITEQWNLIIGILFVVSILTFRRGILRELKEKTFPARPDGPRRDKS
jgi:branched-chain amino acid transport system permease protein